MTRHFERWLFETWYLPPAQLVAYRGVVCIYLLAIGVVRPLLLHDVPPDLLRPPLGPFMLLTGYPPVWLLLTLQASACVALCLLFIGRAPRATGAAATLCAVLVSGFTYSVTGKVDHNILLVLAPLACGFATASPGDEPRARDGRAWPVAAFAAVVGFALFTSAVYKVAGGWLVLDDSSVQGAQLRNLHVYGRDALLAPFAAQLKVAWFWEALDWGTVIVEGIFLLAPFWPRLMRLAIVAMSGLHFGIVLLMNISFAGNIVVYALFMRWPRSVLRGSERAAGVVGHTAPWIAVTGGLAIAAFIVAVGPPLDLLGRAIGPHWIGAFLCAAGAGFVLACALQPADNG